MSIHFSPYEAMLRSVLDVGIPMSSHPWPRSKLRHYQVRMVEIIKRVWAGELPGGSLALDMGSGKSATTLTALVDLLAEGKVKRPLIVAPKLVAATVWPDEIER